jgi:hypothetical protein
VFDGIKLVCMGAKDIEQPWIQCLHPIIVPAGKFLKISNIRFKCPECGRESDKLGSYFATLVKLNKAANNFDKSGFYIKNYELVYQGSYEEGFENTPYVLENEDWTNWNMQIASITIAFTDMPSVRSEIWEDHFYKARPFVYPHQWKLTFGSVLRRKTLYYHNYEINLDLLKQLINEIRNYNNAWLQLIDSFASGAPVDLKHSLYSSLNNVESLAELFDDSEKYD